MAMGIDDALAAAAAGISLTDTCVRTIKAYRKQGKDLDIERLIEEVRITALQRPTWPSHSSSGLWLSGGWP
jgi:hypothetical protein